MTIVVDTACVAPAVIDVSAAPATITAGQSSVLTAIVTGTPSPALEWFIGLPGDITTRIFDATLTSILVTPSQTTTYWMRASGCLNTANSLPLTVVVRPACSAPAVAQPANQTIATGTRATLVASAIGTLPLHYRWFRGSKPDESVVVGSDSPELRTDVLSTRTQFWVLVTNDCGSVASDDVTVDATPARRRSTRH